MNIIIISIGLSFCLVSILWMMLTPYGNSKTFSFSKDSNLSPEMKKVLNLVGGDILSLVPKSVVANRKKNKKIEHLFIKSGNTWNVTQTEFLLIQIMLGFLFFLMSFVLKFTINLNGTVLIVTAFGLAILGYQIPVLVYSSEAKDREAQFKTQLPNAIDFLVMAMSGAGSNLPNAIEMSIRYLPDNVIKEEFNNILEELETGKSLTQALNDFALRVPTSSIEAFVRALNNATALNVPTTEILKQRSSESRKELNHEIERKISTLPSKLMLVIVPVCLVSIILIVVTPMLEILLSI